MKVILIASFLLLPLGTYLIAETKAEAYRFPHAADSLALSQVVPSPIGFQRKTVPSNSFARWLRDFPVRKDNIVRLYNGEPKARQDAHHLVLDIDVGSRDLQQCADAVIRLRAEYLFQNNSSEQIAFHFTNGDLARWNNWQVGYRPTIKGNVSTWAKANTPDNSYSAFSEYLRVVFTYSGSASLMRELKPVPNAAQVEIGDVFIQGGFPGHAVIVMDMAKNSDGERVFLLAQSYMPAQDIHLLKNLNDLAISPWYRAQKTGLLETPEWRFNYTDLRRFN